MTSADALRSNPPSRTRRKLERPMSLHRTMPTLPSDPAAVKAEIRWIQEHRLWTHPVTIKVPPEGQSLFQTRPVPGNPSLHEVVPPGPGWHDEVIHDGSMLECVDVDIVYVNPANRRIDDDDSLNTQFEVWLEGGGWLDLSEDANAPGPEGGWNQYNKWCRCHDPDLDCGAPTLLEALLKLARLVRFYYSDDGTHRKNVPERCQGRFLDEDLKQWQSGHSDAGDGFCALCGYEIV